MSNQSDDANHKRLPAVPSRRDVLIVGATLAAAPLVRGLTSIVEAQAANKGTIGASAAEWVSYAVDKASSKHSPLDQIGPGNFNRLQVAWTWRSAEEAITKQILQ